MARAFDPKPDNIAVAQLVHLHADLGGKLLAYQPQASRLASDMRHVEAVIWMFDPAYDVGRISVKRRQSRNLGFKRGHMFRAAIDVLREAEGHWRHGRWRYPYAMTPLGRSGAGRELFAIAISP
jgi:hypothetical protein